MDVVVVLWDGGSNSQPFEVLCAALVARGDTVRVISHEALRSTFETLGAVFESLPVGERVVGFRARSPTEEMKRVDGIWLSPVIASALESTLDAGNFDVAVVDVTMLTAISACETVGLPLALMHHTLPGAYWGGRRGGRLAGFVGPVNRVRAELGLAPASSYGDLIRHARLHIAATSATLDLPVQWPVPLHYVGPLQPAHPGDEVIELPTRFVLVSFSTTWQRQVGPLQRVVDALADLDRPVVVTTGPALDPTEVVPADNTIVVSQLPHSRILDRVDLVVTHAGHGTVLSSLSAGVPLVCMPMGRDQHDVSARVVAIGAGIVADPDAAQHVILDAARQVLDDNAFQSTARDIAQSIAAEPGVDGAVALVDRAAGR